MSTIEVSLALGVTYRQLDYWVRAGLIPGMSERGPGSGGRRQWTPDQVDAARRVAALSEVRRRSFAQMLGADG